MQIPYITIAIALFLGACQSPSPRYLEAVAQWEHREPPLLSKSQTLQAHLPKTEVSLTTLEDALTQALESHPSVQAARANWKAAVESLPEASALPDPLLSGGWFTDSIETKDGPMQGKIGLRQSFPWPGTLDSASERVQMQILQAAYQVQATQRSIRENIIQSLAELMWREQAVLLTQSHIQLLKEWEAITFRRYELSQAKYADVLRLRSKTAELENKLATLQSLGSTLEVKLKSAIGLPSHSALLVDDFALPTVPLLTVATPQWDPLAHPSYQAIVSQELAAQKGISLAELRAKPNFTLGVEYTFIGDSSSASATAGDDATALVFGFTLPWNTSRNQSRIEKARAQFQTARAMRDGLQLQLESKWAQASFKSEDALRRIALQEKTLIPEERELLSQLENSYSNSKASFLDLTRTQERLLSLELSLARANADLISSLATLENLSGQILIP